MKKIELTRNKFTLVDDEDYEGLTRNKWCCSKSGYATCKKNNKTVYMHKVIMGNPTLSVDHINGNKLDNRKSNLRLATHSNNTKNRSKNKTSNSKYKGVGFEKRKKQLAS